MKSRTRTARAVIANCFSSLKRVRARWCSSLTTHIRCSPRPWLDPKALVERGLCVVLIGHPRLGFTLARGQMEEIGMRCERIEIRGLAGEVETYLTWLLKQAGGQVGIFTPEARQEIANLCRTPLQVKRIAWEAIKQGYEEGEKQISQETILNVISPDFRDIRTELKRLGYTVRDIAYDYRYSTKQVNRFLDGKLAADDPAGRQMSVFLKSLGLGL